MNSLLVARVRRSFTTVGCIAVVCAVMAPASHAAASPPAQGLCAKAAAGTLDGALAGKDTQVVTACTAQRASFAAANSAFATTQAALRTRAAAARAAAKAACEDTSSGGDDSPTTAAAGGQGSGGPSAACRTAREQARAALKQVGVEMRAARTTRNAALKQARITFRSTIRSLAAPAA